MACGLAISLAVLRRQLFLDADAEGFHLAIEVAALKSETFCSAADVAVELIQFFQDVIALVGFAGLME